MKPLNIIESTVNCRVDAGADIFRASTRPSEYRTPPGTKSAQWFLRNGDFLAGRHDSKKRP
jgi:hypothetical protein